jgi:biotin synthase
LSTIEAVRAAGISVCSGGILGLGEKDEDRVGLIHEVSRYGNAPSTAEELAEELVLMFSD